MLFLLCHKSGALFVGLSLCREPGLEAFERLPQVICQIGQPGIADLIGNAKPSSHFITVSQMVSRHSFSKGECRPAFWIICLTSTNTDCLTVSTQRAFRRRPHHKLREPLQSQIPHTSCERLHSHSHSTARHILPFGMGRSG